MDPESVRQQLQKLERKVDSLRWMQAVQTLALAALAVISLIKLAPMALLLILLLLPAVAYFRHSLPEFAKWSGRAVTTVARSMRRENN